MNYFKRRKVLKSVSASELVPVRVHGHTIVDGRVVILVPKFTGTWVHNLFPRTAKLFYRIKLDEIGTVTWEHISGDRTVEEITKTVEQAVLASGKPLDEASDRISKFMSTLYDWRYITFRQIQ